MRHGHRGAGEIAEAIDNLFAFAALGDLVSDAQFRSRLRRDDWATKACGNFSCAENPRAYEAITRVFNEALARGLWRSRRNSAHRLSEVVERCAPEIKGWCPGALDADGERRRPVHARQDRRLEADLGASQRNRRDIGCLRQRPYRSLATRAAAAAGLRRNDAARGASAPQRRSDFSRQTPRRKAVLNVVASPLAESAASTPTKSARRLARAIAGDAALCALPGKFLFLVDHGGAPGLADVGADIRLEPHERRNSRSSSTARATSAAIAIPATRSKRRSRSRAALSR